MTPQQVLNDAIASFGQFSGKLSQVEDDFWDVVWEVESVLKPAECLATATVSITYTGQGYGSGTLPSDCFEIKSVVRPTDWVILQRVNSFDAVKTFPGWFPTASVYAFDPIGKVLYVNEGVNPGATSLEVGYFAHTARVPATTDLPLLDRLYPFIRVGLMAKLARKAKDMERAQMFEQEYLQLLGVVPNARA